jgi:hypothetical protein
MINFLRPVASMAARTSACDQACGRAIDWRDVREDLADFLEDGIDENAPVRADRGQHGRHAQIPGRPCETGHVVDHQTGINGMHRESDPRLVIYEHQDRVLDG